MNRPVIKKWLSLVLCIAVLLSCVPATLVAATSEQADSSFQVHFIDVGQADAALILCDGAAMLIDGGNRADSQLMYSYMQKMNVQHLDYVIGTHPHEDHIGGIAGALQYADSIGTVYCSATSYASSAFSNFVSAVQQHGKTVQVPTVGTTFSLGSAVCKIIAVNTSGSDVNDTSIVMRITYGENSFLFTGDAETPVEKALLESGETLKSDVLKVGHHGSASSTGYLWLREVDPDYAVISVGAGNEYGHPTETVLSRLRDAEVKTYRTDMQGDIICISDGKNLTFSVARNPDADTFGGIGDNSTVTPVPTVPAVTAVQTNTPYKLGIDRNGTMYYFAGCTDGVSYFLASTTDVQSAATVYLEGAEDQYKLYFYKDGVKTYIRLYEREAGSANYGKPSLALTTSVPAESCRFDAALKTLVYTSGVNSYYFGTYNSYTNFRSSNTYYVTGSNAAKVDVSQFPARFYAVEDAQPSITAQPGSRIVKSGCKATFTVAATGNDLSYQWQYRASSADSWKSSAAASGKTASYCVNAETRHHGYQYRCRITDSAGNRIYTKTVRLYVLGVTGQPVSKTAVAGKTVTFTVTATGHKVTYQWQYRASSADSWKNSAAASGKTASYRVNAETRHHGYQYRCRITDSKGQRCYTNTVSLYVLGIKTQPVSRSVKVGATATFTVAAVGKGLTYQWQYRTPSGSWKNVTVNGKNATCSLTVASRHNGYRYRCRIKDSAGNVIYSKTVKLTVNT